VEPVVSIRGVTKRFGAFTALDGVDLEVRAGEIFALLGPNGAGKTTLISIVAGLLRATAGEVRVLGRDVVAEYRETRRALGIVPQELNFDPFFTVEETLRIQAGYFDVRLSEERLAEILGALDLVAKRRTNSRALSGGMKRRLLIGKALVHEPRVLFLDEPTAGVDVELRRSLWRYVRTLRERGTTVVLTTHYLEEAEELADRVGVIHRGRLLVVEETAALLRRHGAKTLRLRLGHPIEQAPAPLAALGARLVLDGAALEIEVAAGTPAGPVLAAVAAAGLAVEDVDTRRTTLEDVFVRLVGSGWGDRLPASAPARSGGAGRGEGDQP
jgi:ABC-2 type transport system ATP-binding protein